MSNLINAKSKKILIVDDEENIRQLLKATLNLGCYKLYEASNGIQALEMARQLKPEIIILDIMLPGGLNGIEVCRRIKEDAALKNTYVLLLSALTQKSDCEAGFAAHADAYLAKPFSPIALIDLIENRRGNAEWV